MVCNNVVSFHRKSTLKNIEQHTVVHSVKCCTQIKQDKYSNFTMIHRTKDIIYDTHYSSLCVINVFLRLGKLLAEHTGQPWPLKIILSSEEQKRQGITLCKTRQGYEQRDKQSFHSSKPNSEAKSSQATTIQRFKNTTTPRRDKPHDHRRQHSSDKSKANCLNNSTNSCRNNESLSKEGHHQDLNLLLTDPETDTLITQPPRLTLSHRY